MVHSKWNVRDFEMIAFYWWHFGIVFVNGLDSLVLHHVCMWYLWFVSLDTFLGFWQQNTIQLNIVGFEGSFYMLPDNPNETKLLPFFLKQIHGYWLFSSLKFNHKASHQLNRCWERLITENWKRMCCVRFNTDLVQSPFPRTRSPISFRMVRASISLNQRTKSCCCLLSLYNQNETNLIHISNQ